MANQDSDGNDSGVDRGYPGPSSRHHSRGSSGSSKKTSTDPLRRNYGFFDANHDPYASESEGMYYDITVKIWYFKYSTTSILIPYF